VVVVEVEGPREPIPETKGRNKQNAPWMALPLKRRYDKARATSVEVVGLLVLRGMDAEHFGAWMRHRCRDASLRASFWPAMDGRPTSSREGEARDGGALERALSGSEASFERSVRCFLPEAKRVSSGAGVVLWPARDGRLCFDRQGWRMMMRACELPFGELWMARLRAFWMT